jgi:hypothetical protein
VGHYKAADRNHPEEKNNLCAMLDNDDGTRSDKNAALALFEEAGIL